MGFSSGRFSAYAGSLLVVLAMVLAGCAAEPAKTGLQSAASSVSRAHDQPGLHPVTPSTLRASDHPGVRIALAQVGAPYRYGGATPRGFDCSGLVYYSYRKAGIRVPRTTGAQLRNAVRVPRSRLRPGDLVFFRLDRRQVAHVGIYTGNNHFVHAPSTGKRVAFTPLDDPYWQQRFLAGGRYF